MNSHLVLMTTRPCRQMFSGSVLVMFAVVSNLLAGSAFVASPLPLAQLPTRPRLCLRRSAPAVLDAQTGEHIFNANCAACHARGQNAIVADHTLEKAAIEKYLTGGFNEKAVAYQIKNGKNAMPAYAERLSETEIGLVAAYVIKTAEDGWD